MKEILLTERRKQNLRNAFGGFTWEFPKATLKNRGLFGDRPQFLIPATFGPLSLIYKQASPDGKGNPSLRVSKDGKKLFTISPAYQMDGRRIMNLLTSYF